MVQACQSHHHRIPPIFGWLKKNNMLWCQDLNDAPLEDGLLLHTFGFLMMNLWFLWMTSRQNLPDAASKADLLLSWSKVSPVFSGCQLLSLRRPGVERAGNLLRGDLQRWKAEGQGPGNPWSGPESEIWRLARELRLGCDFRFSVEMYDVRP